MIPAIPDALPPFASRSVGVWLKGDWHMHSRHSTDSTNNPQSRIIGFAEPAMSERSYYRVEIEGPQAPYPEVPNSMAQSQVRCHFAEELSLVGAVA